MKMTASDGSNPRNKANSNVVDVTAEEFELVMDHTYS